MVAIALTPVPEEAILMVVTLHVPPTKTVLVDKSVPMEFV
jgi:hypothetical protein